MKKVVLLLTTVFLVFTSMADGPEFQQAMGKTLAGYADCKTIEDYQGLANKFERIANAEKAEWLPLYYHAHCYIIMSFMEQSDMAKKDEYLDVAEISVNKMIGMVPDESEVYALQAFMLTARLVVDPMTRGQQYSILSGKAVGTAIALNTDNPRAKLISIQNEMGSAQFFGSDVSKYCVQAKDLLENWDDFKPASSIHPAWGKDQVEEIVNSCKAMSVSDTVSAQDRLFTLELEITALRSDEGKVAIQLLNETEAVVKELYAEISGGECIVNLDSLSPGKYALKYYHDENENGELDTGLFGIPEEGYGFSNNARGKYGPPEFKEWLFVLDKDIKMELITVN
ncbi:MAG: DUF2141 domain-containing protein [Bacteroidetes bacterium]|nr:DUF2141 domain-containing protein [Bacteroidota bacterium]